LPESDISFASLLDACDESDSFDLGTLGDITVSTGSEKVVAGLHSNGPDLQV